MPLFLALALLLLFPAAVFGAESVEVKDDYGHAVRLPVPAQRIVSLSPHLTELLYAAGAGAKLVGALEHSDYPPAARALPRVGSDAGIDIEAVLALRPDLVVAWPNAGSRRAVDRLAGLGLAVFRSEPREIDDIATTLERFGVLAGTVAAASAAAASFRARTAALRQQYAERSLVRVFYQVWDRPLVTVNGEHVISKVLRICGGENVFAELPVIAPEVDREAVLRANPMVIISSGQDAMRPAWLDAWKAFPGLDAAARGHLYAVAPELIQRHTPRILDGAEHVCGLLDKARPAR
jgi:iron complex transport system substrate-binding protein